MRPTIPCTVTSQPAMYEYEAFSTHGMLMYSFLIPLVRQRNLRHANVSLLEFHWVTESKSRLPIGLTITKHSYYLETGGQVATYPQLLQALPWLIIGYKAYQRNTIDLQVYDKKMTSISITMGY